ncbi:MAG: DUF839 domain-containing protein, partial [Erythrobacter sp.]
MPDFRPDRRQFLSATGIAFAALLASGCRTGSPSSDAGAVQSAPTPTSGASGAFAGYGPLRRDPDGLLDLPEGFSYRAISRLGDAMDDGGTVPDRADGMGAFDIGNGEIALVRNHELRPGHGSGGVIASGYDRRRGEVLPGGTTTLVLDSRTLSVKRQFRSLGGTIRNCAGGTTPWGTWLSCEETVLAPGVSGGEGLSRSHGWVFEVPAAAPGLADPAPLTAMGRFNHEAACVDPETGFVYMTEDRDDSVFYRFVPDVPGDLAKGGRLQAMAIENLPDTRNWTGTVIAPGQSFAVRWIDMDEVEAPADDLRRRAADAGASLIARGEGLHMGEDALFICSTSGGLMKLGQIFRLVPGRGNGPDRVELFFESESEDQFNYGDNLCVAPNGHLVVCEDQYTDIVDNHLRGITPDGRPYDF